MILYKHNLVIKTLIGFKNYTVELICILVAKNPIQYNNKTILSFLISTTKNEIFPKSLVNPLTGPKRIFF